MEKVTLDMLKGIFKSVTGHDMARDMEATIADKDASKAYLAKLNKKRVVKDNEIMLKNKRDRFFRNSVWSGGPIEFTFYDWDYRKQKNEAVARQKARDVYNLTKNLSRNHFNVLLSGRPGTGKTSLGIAMLEELRKDGKSTLFVATDEMARMFDGIYKDDKARRDMRLLVKSMKQVDVLLLDDFGTEGGMKGDFSPVRKDMQARLYEIANARFGHKSTIITTNNTDRELGLMYNPKLLSRLIPQNPSHRIDFAGLEDVRKSML